jgi:hypothetical protein
MKVEDDPANPQYLITDSHIGYRFNEGVEDAPLAVEGKSEEKTAEA